MATKKAKPNGHFHLLAECVEQYFRDIPICDLPGVGYSTTQKLANLQVNTCAELQHMTIGQLQEQFGRKLGETLHQHCRGIDSKPLTYHQVRLHSIRPWILRQQSSVRPIICVYTLFQVRKSVSAEVNYGIRFTEEHELDAFLGQLCAEVHSRLTEIAARGKSVTLKYMVRAADAPVETAKFMGHGYCDHVTKTITLQQFTANLTVITQTVFNIKNILRIPPKELRGIGIQMSKLDTGEKQAAKKNALRTLFEKQKQRPTEEVADKRAVTNPLSRSQSMRRVKSFGGTPSPGEARKFRPSQRLHKIFEELDLDVLAELPDDIRNEIIQEQERILQKTADDRKIVPAMFDPQAKRRTARNLASDYEANETNVNKSHGFDPFARATVC